MGIFLAGLPKIIMPYLAHLSYIGVPSCRIVLAPAASSAHVVLHKDRRVVCKYTFVLASKKYMIKK